MPAQHQYIFLGSSLHCFYLVYISHNGLFFSKFSSMNHVERIFILELSRSSSKCIIRASLRDFDQIWRNPHAHVVSLVLKTVVEEPVSSPLHHQLASPSDYEGAALKDLRD